MKSRSCHIPPTCLLHPTLRQDVLHKPRGRAAWVLRAAARGAGEDAGQPAAAGHAVPGGEAAHLHAPPRHRGLEAAGRGDGGLGAEQAEALGTQGLHHGFLVVISATQISSVNILGYLYLYCSNCIV